MADKTFEVTLEDSSRQRGWKDPDTGELTSTSTITVSAANADAAKTFAEEHNGDLKAIEAKELK